jgi:hypothetical protein
VGVDGVVAILISLLSFILLIAAVASGYESIDLLPTSIGVLYALAGAVAACAAVITFAIAVLIRRFDKLREFLPQSAKTSFFPAGFGVTPLAETAPTQDASAVPLAIEAEGRDTVYEARGLEDESPININRAGHLPSLEAIETVLEEPQGPPTLIGSYSSAGANYKIFADGSIEAETNEGTFTFASMNDFKRHLAERGNANAARSGD